MYWKTIAWSSLSMARNFKQAPISSATDTNLPAPPYIRLF